MSGKPIQVLKFGSSVLTGAAGFQAAASEIYRHHRQGKAVVAVVSALAGETDRLLSLAGGVSTKAKPRALAALAATGESAAAWALAIALDRIGLSAEVMEPAQCNLRVAGDPLDAAPVAVNATRIRDCLATADVVIVPGFSGIDSAGRPALLGRGGSDLTALFLARALKATHCKLVKDVRGVFERDPALAGPPPRRFASIPWGAVAQIARVLVQEKADRFAERQHLAFEVGNIGGRAGTRVGPGPARFADASPAPVRVALLGLGTVGGAVADALSGEGDRFQVIGALVRSTDRPDRTNSPRLFTEPNELLSEGPDVIIECLGGRAPALSILLHALGKGISVVTANKLVVAEAGPQLETAARAGGAALHYSATVGGGVPVLETIRRLRRDGAEIIRFRAVLNGTCNYILDRLSEGAGFEAALREAREQGFAEADASLDIDGWDTLYKGMIVARAAFEVELRPAEIARSPIAGLPRDILAGPRPVRQVLELTAECGNVRARVAPLPLDPEDFLAGARAEENRAEIETADGRIIRLSGKGAGGAPTAEAILADLHDYYASIETGARRLAAE